MVLQDIEGARQSLKLEACKGKPKNAGHRRQPYGVPSSKASLPNRTSLPFKLQSIHRRQARQEFLITLASPTTDPRYPEDSAPR
jgi:hypothetical protein